MEIRTLCLGILALGDATGYEIKKLIADGAFSLFSEASYGSIYPALSKLMEEGLVTCNTQAQDGKPDKKIYALTQEGRSALTQSLEQAPGRDRQRSEFLATVLFAEAVSPHRLNSLVSERCRYHQDRIAELEAMLASEMTQAAKFVIGYGLYVQKAALNFLTQEGDALSQPRGD